MATNRKRRKQPNNSQHSQAGQGRQPKPAARNAQGNQTGQSAPPKQDGNWFTLSLGREELIIHRRYQVLSIANDFLIAIWYLVGSVFFLYASLEKPGVWLFIIGSAQFLIRPAIRLARQFHLKRLPASHWDM